MSVYNGVTFLKDSIESILSQSFTEFEFIIFDDNSHDGSQQILQEYAKNDSRIKVITNKSNKGLGANLQKGVKLASGKYIARMDDDDIAAIDRLQIQYEYALANPQIDIIGSIAIDIDENNNEVGIRRVPLYHNDIVNYIWTCPIIHPTVLFKKEAILKAGSYGNERRRQDYALWFRCANHGLKFANIDKPLLRYRFYDIYYKKNDLTALIYQVKIGLKGCRLVKASPIAYIGVCIPLVKGILPRSLKKGITILMKKFDPRYK
jgi:glycosyltransferase involved in cell wall biosynthesis